MSPHFNIIELEQGSTPWRAWRHQGIGASDAAAIMGECRFKTAAALLEEKRQPPRDSGQTAAMAFGTHLEPMARQLYIAKTGKDVRPACLQSTRFDWLRASVDGLAADGKAVVEIKCGRSAYRIVAQTGAVPPYYYGQLQHILAVTNLASLDFWCYWPTCPERLVVVPRNETYIDRLLEKHHEFWLLIEKDRVPNAALPTS